MNKTFSKDSLKVGDKIGNMVVDDRYVNGIVCEVLNNVFILDLDGILHTIPYKHAIKEDWTILPEEPEQKNTFAVYKHWKVDGKDVTPCTPNFENTSCNHATFSYPCHLCKEEKHQEIIKDAIIKNNNELIEEIEGMKNNGCCCDDECSCQGEDYMLDCVIQLIQSKNDLLSKE